MVAVISLTALPAYCAQTIPQTATKFLFAMGGVVASSLIIYIGLTIYNKIFAKHKFINSEDMDHFSNPLTTDDAIASFIKRNQLR